MRRILVLLTTMLLSLGTLITPAQAAGYDDYPWKYVASGTDPWGFTMRQATSFAAWRMYQYGYPLSNSAQRWGTPANWDNTAARLGVRISSYPVQGAIAQANEYEKFPYYANGSLVANGTLQASAQGHVAIVIKVFPDLSALVEQYNGAGAYRSYSQTHVRMPRYLLDGVGGWPVARPS